MTPKKNTYQSFKKYLQNHLLDKQRHTFEKESIKDPFEIEALEGIKEIDPKTFIADTEKLQQKIHQKTKRTGILPLVRKYQMAASILVLIGSAAYFYFTMQPDSPDENIFSPPLQLEEAPSKQIPIKNIPSEEIARPTDDMIEIDKITSDEGMIQQNDDQIKPKEEVIMEETELEEIIVMETIEAAPSEEIVPVEPTTNKQLPQLQNHKITRGTVVDSQGHPLPGVSVHLKEGNKETVTDFDGNFDIETDTTGTLVFDYIGFEQAMKQANDSMLIVMQESENSLEEVVVIGYGTTKKKDVTGAVTKIKAKDLKSSPSSILEDTLNGNVAGVMITNETSTKPIPPQGHIKDFILWVQTSFDTSILASNESISISVNFTINKNGKLTKIKFNNKPRRKVRNEIKKILKSNHEWIPAKEDGKIIEETVQLNFTLIK